MGGRLARSGTSALPRRVRVVGGLIGVALACSCGTAAVHASSRATPPPASVGVGGQLFSQSQRRPLPQIAGTTLSGQPLSLRSLTGHGVVVVNVWASWCAPCRDESAVLATIAKSTASDAVRFVGIDEQDTPSVARKFVASTGTTYPQLTDPTGTNLNKLSLLPSMAIPSTLLVDKRGMMAARIVGPVTTAKLEKLIAQVASES
jgi:thiol-disulfide isomerase/thioredoxin